MAHRVPGPVRRTYNVRPSTLRFRGLDHNEVRAFLRTLADDLERLDGQIVTLTQENERLRGELEESEARPRRKSPTTR